MQVVGGNGPTWPEAQCLLTIRLWGVGSGKAILRSASFRFFMGVTRATPASSDVASQAELRSLLGSDTIVINDTLATQLETYGGLPFEVEVAFHYERVGGMPDSVKTQRHACGPTPPATSPPWPALSHVSVSPSGVLEPGQEFAISYRASGSMLWATELTGSDAFDFRTVNRENQLPEVLQTFRSSVPVQARMGRSLVVDLATVDAWGQFTDGTVVAGMVSDTSPPQLIASVASTCCGSPSNAMRGNYFIGDSASLDVHVSDRHRARKVVWELLPGTARDSFVTSGPGTVFGMQWRVPIGSDWAAGAGREFRVVAWDSVGLSTEVTLARDTSFRLYPSVTRPITWRALDLPGVVRIDSARNRVYLLYRGHGRVVALDAATLSTVFDVTLGAYTQDIELTAGGDSLVAVLQEVQSLAFLDLRGAAPVATTFRLTALANTVTVPRHVATAANGRLLLTLSYAYGVTGGPLELNLVTMQQTFRTDAAPITSSSSLEASPERDIVVYSTDGCTQVYVAATNTFGPCKAFPWAMPVNVSRAPHVIALHRSIYDTDLNLIRSVPSLRGSAQDDGTVWLTADGRTMYHTGPAIISGLGRSRVSDGALIDRTTAALRLHRLFPDGERAFVTRDGAVGIMDLREASATPLGTVAGQALRAARTPSLPADASSRRTRSPRAHMKAGVRQLPRP